MKEKSNSWLQCSKKFLLETFRLPEVLVHFKTFERLLYSCRTTSVILLKDSNKNKIIELKSFIILLGKLLKRTICETSLSREN